MLQPGRTLRFTLKPFESNPVASWIKLLHLERHIPTQPSVMGRPDAAHPASPDRALQPIAAHQQHPHIHAPILLEAVRSEGTVHTHGSPPALILTSDNLRLSEVRKGPRGVAEDAVHEPGTELVEVATAAAAVAELDELEHRSRQLASESRPAFTLRA
jgi:hypothetical protein